MSDDLPNRIQFEVANRAGGGINEDLVRRYHEAGDLPNLLSCFNFLWRSRERAESLSRAYLDQMIRQGAELDRLKNRSKQPVAENPRTQLESPTRKPRTRTPTGAIDIEL